MKNKYLTLLAASCVAANAANVNYDLLGRKGSKMNSPMVYKNVDYSKVNKNEEQKVGSSLAGGLAKVHPAEPYVTPVTGSFEVYNLGAGKYTLNGVSVTESQYKTQIKQFEDNDAARNAFIYGGNAVDYPTKNLDQYWYAYAYTANPCAGLNECQLQVQTAPNNNENIVFWNKSLMLNQSALYSMIYNKGYTGNDIGISFTDDELPESRVFGNQLRIGGDCENPTSIPGIIHATNVARTINQVAPSATIYGYSNNCANYNHYGNVVVPINGYDLTPQIFIGTLPSGNLGKTYTSRSRYIDEIIYKTRMIEFAGAGDDALQQGRMSDMAMGVNVISVGAVHNDNTYHATSSWQNPKHRRFVGDNKSGKHYYKPEIANYSDILFPDDQSLVTVGNAVFDSYFSQTSAAAAYTAASTALLLDKYPFYKWHPEVVKSLLIALSTKELTNSCAHDQDNQDCSSIGVPNGMHLNFDHRSRFWNGNNHDFFDGNDEISFVESKMQEGYEYRIAISWLSSGEYVYQNGKMSQDFGLEIFDGDTPYYSWTMSNYDEMKNFQYINLKKKKGQNLRIVIKRVRNDGGRVLLGYSLVRGKYLGQ